MWMTKKDIADYPELFIYLAKVQIFLTVAKLMKNLRHWGDYDNPGNPKSIKLAPIFLYGTNPLVKVRRLSGFICSIEYAYGCVDATRPWEIGLDRNMVESFNSDPYNYVNWDNTAKGDFVPIVGVTILHELCHWGRLQSENPLIGIEEGDEFEKATYGTLIGGHRF